MESAALLRTLSCSSSACLRLLSRCSHRCLPRRACSSSSVPSITSRKQLLHTTRRIRSPPRRNLRWISSSPSLNHRRKFSSLAPQAIATSPKQFSPDIGGSKDEYAEKLGFQKVSEQVIDELKSSFVLYKHKKTGAEVMSVSNDDENKVFGIVFRTPPKDSTGIPHILEHSVLCGSRKYPLKEPFVELLKGSLQNLFECIYLSRTKHHQDRCQAHRQTRGLCYDRTERGQFPWHLAGLSNLLHMLNSCLSEA